MPQNEGGGESVAILIKHQFVFLNLSVKLAHMKIIGVELTFDNPSS